MRLPLADPGFWRDRTVLVTGHTGFKGAWLTLWLQQLGARVTGVSNGVPTAPSLYELARVGEGIDEIDADVRDRAAVLAAVAEAEPQIVIHMAAQPIVRRSFADPHGTYETNVMGTVNVLEAVRRVASVRVVLTVTTDKCYENTDPAARRSRPFVEGDPKGGHDPYSSSKGCAELVVDAYLHSFFGAGEPGYEGPRLGSARAGNVIGGGDWGADRLIPDIMRGALAAATIPVRNPEAVRPWQHVLNALSGYLRLVQLLYADPALQGAWNFGPALDDARSVRWIADRLTELWSAELRWELDPGPHPQEAAFLALDSSKAHERLGWVPTWGLEEALSATVAWYEQLAFGADMRAATLSQAHNFSEVGITEE